MEDETDGIDVYDDFNLYEIEAPTSPRSFAPPLSEFVSPSQHSALARMQTYTTSLSL